jgi:hypothetical protein
MTFPIAYEEDEPTMAGGSQKEQTMPPQQQG